MQSVKSAIFRNKPWYTKKLHNNKAATAADFVTTLTFNLLNLNKAENILKQELS